MACPGGVGTRLEERTVLNYPGSYAGVGLLLLRVTVGVTAALQGWLSVASANGDPLRVILAAALIAGGVALIIGVFTAVSSLIVGLGHTVALLTPFDGTVLLRVDDGTLVSLAAAVAIALLGPGAFSLDARLFGRREIFIPAQERSQ